MLVSGILLLVGFGIFAVLMAVRLLPTLLALPLVLVIFGAMFAKVIQKTGIADSIIRKAAELAGDKPFTIVIFMGGATAFIFTGMSGLGTIIMIGTIAVPIMTSAGIKPIDAVILLLLGLWAGLAVNFSNMATLIGILGMDAALTFSRKNSPASIGGEMNCVIE